MATIDELVYPEQQLEAESEHLRARAHQTLRLLGTHAIAAYQEFGGADRLLVASDLGVHEFAYRPAPDDPFESTVSQVLTRWANVKGVEMALRYARADSPRYAVHVSIREPGVQGALSVAGDEVVPLVEFGAACLALRGGCDPLRAQAPSSSQATSSVRMTALPTVPGRGCDPLRHTRRHWQRRCEGGFDRR